MPGILEDTRRLEALRRRAESVTNRPLFGGQERQYKIRVLLEQYARELSYLLDKLESGHD
jgi:hypothetical protein